MSQLDLITGDPVQPPRDPDALTERQQHALTIIGRLQPITSDELGAHLHAYRLANGGKGHSPDERCAYCTSEGRDVGNALRRRDIVVQKRTVGWALPEYRPVPAGTDDGYDPTKSEIPF